MTNLALYYRFCDAVKEYYSKKRRGIGNIIEEYADAEIFKLSVQVYCSKEYDKIKEMMRERGWKPFSNEEIYDMQINIFKSTPRKADDLTFDSTYDIDRGLPRVYKREFNLIYNRKQDKVAINFRDKGFAYNFTKMRYYPVIETEPVLTKTDRFWYFKRAKRGEKLKVREFKINHTLPDVVEYAIRKIFNMTEVEDKHEISFYTFSNENGDGGAPDLLFRRVLENRDLIKVIEETHKVSLPKALKRQIHVSDLANLARIVEANDFNKLCQVMVKYWEKNNTEIPLDELIRRAYKSQFSTIEDDNRLSNWMIIDIIREHVVLNRKLNLKIKSYKRLMEIHNECSALLRSNSNTPISVKKKFLKCFNGFKGDYELITTRARLNQEGAQMSHCVAGYGPNINKGYCCIVSILWTDGHRYTAEIRQDSETKKFFIQQLQGYKNSIHGKPPQELYDKIFNECRIYPDSLKLKNQPEIVPVLQEI